MTRKNRTKKTYFLEESSTSFILELNYINFLMHFRVFEQIQTT